MSSVGGNRKSWSFFQVSCVGLQNCRYSIIPNSLSSQGGRKGSFAVLLKRKPKNPNYHFPMKMKAYFQYWVKPPILFFKCKIKVKKIRCRFIVWYLARSAWLHTITPLVTGPIRSYIAISTPRGAYSPPAISAHETVQTHKPSLSYQVLTPGSRECTCEQSALPRSTMSEHIQRSQGSNPWSLACTLCTLSLSRDAPCTSLYSVPRIHHLTLFPAINSDHPTF